MTNTLFLCPTSFAHYGHNRLKRSELQHRQPPRAIALMQDKTFVEEFRHQRLRSEVRQRRVRSTTAENSISVRFSFTLRRREMRLSGKLDVLPG